jgi:hypothetical protein
MNNCIFCLFGKRQSLVFDCEHRGLSRVSTAEHGGLSLLFARGHPGLSLFAG